jgi:dihydrofolate reductase
VGVAGKAVMDMRRLIADSIISLDGYFTGSKNEIDWFEFTNDEYAWSGEILQRVDTMIYGRVTYEEFRQFFPTPEAKSSGFDPYIVRRLNELPKVVFSKSLEEAPWKPSIIVRESPVEAIPRMKGEPGKDMVVVGSGSLVAALTREGLIDEYRIRIRPIILGSGRPLFEDRNHRQPLTLVSVKPFKSGVVGLHYEPLKVHQK